MLFTTEAFQPQGLPRPNVPMLLDAKMRLAEPACAWLLHIALVRGRTRSKKTWRTYGEALYDWWQTLEANGWAWDKVGSNELTAYRNHMLERTSEHTGRPSRPTRSVRPLACSASKRLATELARCAARARTGPAMPLRSLAPRS
jgi:hypothetical protein